MKKGLITLAMLSVIAGSANAAGAVGSATAAATWEAIAVKKTTDQLTITPMDANLNFDYSPASKQFNELSSNFDVTLLASSDTAVKLYAKLVSNQLTNVLDTKNALEVAPKFGDKAVTKDGIDLLTNGLSLSKNGTGVKVATGQMNFDIARAFEVAAPANTVAFDALPDGQWDGDVTIQFTASWWNE